MSAKKPRIEYHYRGRVERAVANHHAPFRWHDGYSANGPGGGPLSPWMTMRECREDAARQGAVAVFVRSPS